MTFSQRIAIVALILTPSVPAAARAAGLSSKTLHRWHPDPDFRPHLERNRRIELVRSQQTASPQARGRGDFVTD
jgi:hypothetical protein